MGIVSITYIATVVPVNVVSEKYFHWQSTENNYHETKSLPLKISGTSTPLKINGTTGEFQN